MLLVNDDKPCLSMYKFYLEQYQIQFEEATNGKEAINIVEKRSENVCLHRFKVFLMYNFIPIMSGIEVGKRITDLLKDKNIEISLIILKAGDESQSNEINFEGVFTNTLTKTINFKSFKEAVIKPKLI